MFKVVFNPNPEVTRCGHITQLFKWHGHSGRKINENILIVITEGVAVFTINGEVFSVAQGDMLFIPKNTFYVPIVKDSCKYYFFHFDCSIEQVMMDSFTKNYYCIPDTKQFAQSRTCYDFLVLPYYLKLGLDYNKIIFQIQACLQQKKSITRNGKVMMDLYFSQLIVALSDLYISNSNPLLHNKLPALLEKIVLYIKENYTERFTLHDLSIRYQISKQYIIRLFKVHLNTTAMKFINDEKLRRAVELLIYSNMNITQIAEHLGFDNVYYFSKIFKQRHGLSPSLWLKEELNR